MAEIGRDGVRLTTSARGGGAPAQAVAQILAVMESHGAEDSEGKLEHKLRRAGEIAVGRG